MQHIDYFCDCSENFLITFEKFYIVNVGPQGVGYLAFEEGSMGYETFEILPTEGVVGSFVPFVPGCWEYEGYYLYSSRATRWDYFTGYRLKLSWRRAYLKQ
jgi:hypothetical protein